MNNLVTDNYLDLVDVLDRMEIQYIQSNQDLVTLLIRELKIVKEKHLKKSKKNKI